MKFQGRIKKLLPARQGVSLRTGNEWKALPFIFEYFENPNDRYADEVVLETFDTNIIPHLKENMEVIIGFGSSSQRVHTDNRRQGRTTPVHQRPANLFVSECSESTSASGRSQQHGGYITGTTTNRRRTSR